ncbi:MAG: hypothetical protein IPN77_26665 [Sandaracinaceae bacterium]|nr:hypothetical protein [Sandaracinaceae bacterium]
MNNPIEPPSRAASSATSADMVNGSVKCTWLVEAWLAGESTLAGFGRAKPRPSSPRAKRAVTSLGCGTSDSGPFFSHDHSFTRNATSM